MHLCVRLVLIMLVAAVGFISSCSWWDLRTCDEDLNSPVRPKLGLVFLHMRKAGGTHVLNTIEDWFGGNNCISAQSNSQFRNVIAGQLHSKTIIHAPASSLNADSSCPQVDILHSEFSCLTANSLLSLPKRNERKHSHLRFLTILRHPMQRIMSQVFYYGGVGHQLIDQFRKQKCPEKAHDSRFVDHCFNYSLVHKKEAQLKCLCIREAYQEAITELRSNDSLWLEYMKTKGVDNKYMNNYYIKRLSSLSTNGGGGGADG